MSWFDTITSTPALIAGALGITAVVYARRQTAPQNPQPQQPQQQQTATAKTDEPAKPKEKMSVMSPPAANLQPPKVCTEWWWPLRGVGQSLSLADGKGRRSSRGSLRSGSRLVDQFPAPLQSRFCTLGSR